VLAHNCRPAHPRRSPTDPPLLSASPKAFYAVGKGHVQGPRPQGLSL
jgi:hypothetical protein